MNGSDHNYNQTRNQYQIHKREPVNIPWWVVIVGFTMASPLGLGLLIFKLVQESKPNPQRWGQTGPIPTQKVRASASKATSSTSKTATPPASVWKKPKYPLVPLKEHRGLFSLGAAFAAFWVFVAAVILSDWGLGYLSYALEEIIPCIPFALAGVGTMLWSHFKTKEVRKFKNYLARLGNEPLVPLRPLAESIPASMDEVCETLQRMIDRGVFGDKAYLDLSAETLVLDGSAARPTPNARPAAKPQPSPTASEEEILRQIRTANDRIPGEEISRKIHRIEEITRHILLYLKKHPERASELHTFLDYYLPTTLKMLNTYAELDEQGVDSDNISATKRKIEGALDKVVEGFEAQLDKLFEGEMLDIASDIDVMEKMLHRDGLSAEMKIPKPAASGYTPHLTLDPDGTAAGQR